MGSVFGFAINSVGTLYALGTTLQSLNGKPPADRYTTVQITAGSGGDSPGGNVPHIALWDNDGNRIGQYHPKKKDKIRESRAFTVAVEHNQIGGAQADPYYIMLSNLENDAICISEVTVAGAKISGTFYGDTGSKCGQSWFLSQNEIGSEFRKSKCVWLDADHSNGINARALSFHLNDMAPSSDKMKQYQDRPETLCKSTPRFSFWGNLLPDGTIPFFKPKLVYLEDSQSGAQGADKDPDRVLDKPNQYNKGIYMYQGEKTKRSIRPSRRGIHARGANKDPGHLIITDNPNDDVLEVCEHPNSYGWDIVSTVQKLYCDMESKQLYHVCDGQNFEDNCFDMFNRTILPKKGIAERDDVDLQVPRKAYTSEAHWKGNF